MTEASGLSDKLAAVAGLAAATADRIREQHEAGTLISDEQFRLLVRATLILVNNDVLWPPSVEHRVQEIAMRNEQAEAKPNAAPALLQNGDVALYLTPYLGALKRT
ncbi:hypothetical protein [Methylobacterium sp. J-070]|uniref:hypothetical protein n=1 Tax=Methylobacterium sp. J-070 TaxID=2836650 RepID=UPI001FB8CA48|nr:hypothetical protein [Methylobacterium sp. J-070]MCJ2049328.1 hypothetical protein [Methylobacterium sp. J-070]